MGLHYSLIIRKFLAFDPIIPSIPAPIPGNTEHVKEELILLTYRHSGGIHAPIINGNSYVCSVHETDSFFYNLGRQDSGYDKPADTSSPSDEPTGN